ncbi:hypothetical protein [Nakamurella endophytica]|uniref:Uncharacterized protein n=1 Tax=Nakamurella endophytica TaxID=1748367 RepID=A0A917T7T7_9ACTN|nr:hypothetical protein [Nakamurella endophytica]GGM12248.1 hypothetical protein GCM10011594_35150 [Nakamurella endophytica]
MFDQWDAAPPTPREHLLADLRRRMAAVIPGGERVGRPLQESGSAALAPDPDVVQLTDDDPAATGPVAVPPPTAGREVAGRFDPAAFDPATVAPAGDRGAADLVAVDRPDPAALGPVAAPTRREVLPAPAPLAGILPAGGLPRGGVVSLAGGQGTTSLLLTLLAAPAPTWSALVGMPGVGLLAGAEFGVDLDRVVLVPDPGPDVLQVLSILADGMDVIAVAAPPGGFTAPARLRVLAGRLRQRGVVLLVAGAWPGADLVLRTRITGWSGADHGHGRLRDRELSVEVRGRGAAGHPRRTTVLLRSTRSAVQVQPVTVPAAPVQVPVAAQVG